jgi:hypothetical protein
MYIIHIIKLVLNTIFDNSIPFFYKFKKKNSILWMNKIDTQGIYISNGRTCYNLETS